ncbi:hypothetical protein [Thalassolituus maritimus]|uniref:Uncharacterized protein n=1 Tax=Thalassolituus maritimus TaxID=484498 RepID=A0ABP9ZWU6_9GAMM
MAVYFLSGVLITLVLCASVRWWIQSLLNQDRLFLDDAKGYFLITCIVVGFLVSAGFFWAGQIIGYDQAEETSQAMGLAILLDVMVALLSLIWGLVSLKEPEQY